MTNLPSPRAETLPSTDMSPWLFTQQVFNKCWTASYQWWQGSEISFFSFTNISPWKDLTGLPYLSSCLIGWSPLLVFQTGAAKQEGQVLWPQCQSFLGYTNDLVSPDPDSGRPHHGDRQSLVRITPPPNLSLGPDLPSLSPGSLFVRVGPLRVLSKLNVCVCGQYLAQEKYAKTVVVGTIPFLFTINFYWSMVCFILLPFPRLPFHRWGNWGSGHTMCFWVPETWVVCLNTSGSKVPVFVPFWDPPNRYPAFRKPACSDFPGWHILFSRSAKSFLDSEESESLNVRNLTYTG